MVTWGHNREVICSSGLQHEVINDYSKSRFCSLNHRTKLGHEVRWARCCSSQVCYGWLVSVLGSRLHHYSTWIRVFKLLLWPLSLEHFSCSSWLDYLWISSTRLLCLVSVSVLCPLGTISTSVLVEFSSLYWVLPGDHCGLLQRLLYVEYETGGGIRM